jgi:hypothetical protein
MLQQQLPYSEIASRVADADILSRAPHTVMPHLPDVVTNLGRASEAVNQGHQALGIQGDGQYPVAGIHDRSSFLVVTKS